MHSHRNGCRSSLVVSVGSVLQLLTAGWRWRTAQGGLHGRCTRRGVCDGGAAVGPVSVWSVVRALYDEFT